MFKVINKQILAENVKRLDIKAEIISAKVQPGQYVNIFLEEDNENLSLPVIDQDDKKGSIAVVFHETDYIRRKLGDISIGDEIYSILGPLGKPVTVEKKGTVVCVSSGIGTANMLPIVRSLSKAGNKVIVIIGAKTKKQIMCEAQIRLSSQKIIVTTKDASYGRRGQATDVLEEVLKSQQVSMVYTIGAPELMESVCALTRVPKIDTRVHLSPVMVDCMGMCGSCRVKVKNKTVFACLEGPEFDGHQVDFEDYKIRLNAFKELGEWKNQKSASLLKTNEKRPFMKFLSGMLNE